MQPSPLSSTRPSARRESIPYSSEAMRQDLQRVRNVWDECQASSDRDAIYPYLNAVYALMTWWAAEGQELPQARRALRLRGLDVSAREGPFAAIIRCTADPAKADKRTRSNGPGCCATRRCTIWIPSHWTSSSSGRMDQQMRGSVLAVPRPICGDRVQKMLGGRMTTSSATSLTAGDPGGNQGRGRGAEGVVPETGTACPSPASHVIQ
jgi:hypothetical protein